MIRGHGGEVYSVASALGLRPTEVLDFSSNVNPFGPPPGFFEALQERIGELRLLPEPDAGGLRAALSEAWGLPPSCFLVGAGTTEWIYGIPRAAGRRLAAVVLPTYADYRDAAVQAGLGLKEFGPHLNGEEALAALLEAPQDGLVFLCNPNNPTGAFLPPERILEAARQRPDLLWVVDESYADFVGPEEETSLLVLRPLPSNLLVLRSFSKIYGVPGLRLGYVGGAEEALRPLRALERPWPVDRLAEIGGAVLLRAREYRDEVRWRLRRLCAGLLRGLRELPFLEPLPGEAHFVLFRLSPPWDAPALTRALAREGILVRDCSNFPGLGPGFVRVSPRDEEANRLLLEALRRASAGSGRISALGAGGT